MNLFQRIPAKYRTIAYDIMAVALAAAILFYGPTQVATWLEKAFNAVVLAVVLLARFNVSDSEVTLPDHPEITSDEDI